MGRASPEPNCYELFMIQRKLKKTEKKIQEQPKLSKLQQKMKEPKK